MHTITWTLQTLVWIPARIIFGFFTGFRVKGRAHLENIAAPVIFASNHPSEIDPLLLPTALNPFSRFFPMYYVARTTDDYTHLGPLKSFFYGGWLFKAWGAYPAYRGKHDYAYSLAEHIRLIKKGKSVQIFPSGVLADEVALFPKQVHGGVAYLAWHLGVPVVPAAICGTYQTHPRQFLTRRRRYKIVFGTPITPSELFGHGYEKKDMPSVDEFHRASERVLNEIRRTHEIGSR